jgi:hypothetical protein
LRKESKTEKQTQNLPSLCVRREPRAVTYKIRREYRTAEKKILEDNSRERG